MSDEIWRMMSVVINQISRCCLLGRYALSAKQEPVSDVALYDIGAAAHELVADSLDAYVTEDVELCYRVAERDDEIDSLCHSASERVVRDLIEREATGEDPWSVEQVIATYSGT
jgi:phosphate transport system protein